MNGEFGELISVFNQLPTNWKIIFVITFFLLPKIIQILGGSKVVNSAIAKFWSTLEKIVRQYQARKQREVEDDSYEVYTRVLVVESLGLFAERLKRMDHKLNFIVSSLEKEVDIEEIENISPERKRSDTIIHSRVHERLRKLREGLETGTGSKTD